MFKTIISRIGTLYLMVLIGSKVDKSMNGHSLGPPQKKIDFFVFYYYF